MKQNLLERAEQLGLPPQCAVSDSDRSSSLPYPFFNLHPPLRIALLGCGTVGGGVLHHLLARPCRFQVTGVLVRDLFKDRGGLPRHLFTADPDELLGRGTDVVVELLGGREPAGRLIRKSLSVGGALPALETVRRAAALGPVRAISGVLNGTCNFVLDRCRAGASFEAAVAEAQAAGYAEADPTLDLDGSDTAQKLALLVREAFGVPLRWDEIPRQGIEGLPSGRIVRLIATCERTADGLAASVRPLELPADHLFARAAGAGNALRIEMEDGSLTELTAQGAGRWPTSASVLADLHDLHGLLTVQTSTEVTA